MKGGVTGYDPKVIRLSSLPIYLRWVKNGSYKPLATQVTWLNGSGVWYGGDVGGKGMVFTSFLARTRNVVFQPGEVRVFSYPYSPNFKFTKSGSDSFIAAQELQPGWDPGAFIGMGRTASIYPANDVSSKNVTPADGIIKFGSPLVQKTVTTLTAATKEKLMFNASDSIGLEIGTGSFFGKTDDGTIGSEINGSGLQFMCIQKGNQSRDNTGDADVRMRNG